MRIIIAVALLVLRGSSLRAETSAEMLPFEYPNPLSGEIYKLGAPLPRTPPVFHFVRNAKHGTNNLLNVTREYVYPGGKLAASEFVTYSGTNLLKYELVDPQTGSHGSARVAVETGKKSRKLVYFEYFKDSRAGTRPRRGSEAWSNDMLISDMLADFILARWNALMAGNSVRCRYLVVERTETIGFKLLLETQTAVRDGIPVVIIKMEPSSPIISALVDPLHIVVEKNPPHRILQYTGRTTPKLLQGHRLIDLDAVTVFDWNAGK
jgi:hypothetical protein